MTGFDVDASAILLAKLKTAPVYHDYCDFGFDHCLENGTQYFRGTVFWNCVNLETGVHEILNAGFRKIFNLESGIRKFLHRFPKQF